MTEGERLTKLETQMDNIEQKVDDLKVMLGDFIEKSDKRFAAKWSERIWYFIFGAVGATLIGAALSKIIIK